MHEIALRENIKTEQLWLDDIPEKIYIKDVKDKYKFKTEENKISLTIGEYDDPSNQKQGIVSHLTTFYFRKKTSVFELEM